MNSEEESDSEIDEGNVLDSDDSDESDGRRTHEKVTGDDFLGSDDGSEEEELPIERQARQLDDQAGREEREDAAERRAHQQGLLAPDAAPDATPAEEPFTPIDLEAVKARIHENVRILENFKALSKEGKTEISRSEYVDQLQDDMAGYYGYLPFLIGKFLDIFSPSQTVEFLEANETDRPVTIRTNTLRSRRKDLHQALQNRGMRVEPMDKWSNVGMVVYQSPVPIGATPEYLAGHYIIQSAASFLPCMALGPAPGERVLDMCAAPGGKAAYLAALMKNTGVLFANDQKLRRIKALNANLHRLGVSNSVITNYDGRQFPTVMRGFDRCLLDAPCTGLGVIAKDPAVKMQRDEEQLLKLSHLQKELLLAAIDCVDADSKHGGVIVYSTCSVAVEENEAVVDYALKHRSVKLVSSGLEFGVPGFCRWRQYRFHPSVALTRRYYPHTHNMDGFYVAKFKKFANAKMEGESAAAKDGAAMEPTIRQFGKLSKKQKRKRNEAFDGEGGAAADAEKVEDGEKPAREGKAAPPTAGKLSKTEKRRARKAKQGKPAAPKKTAMQVEYADTSTSDSIPTSAGTDSTKKSTAKKKTKTAKKKSKQAESPAQKQAAPSPATKKSSATKKLKAGATTPKPKDMERITEPLATVKPSTKKKKRRIAVSHD